MSSASDMKGESKRNVNRRFILPSYASYTSGKNLPAARDMRLVDGVGYQLGQTMCCTYCCDLSGYLIRFLRLFMLVAGSELYL